jgi:hypothetical protein
VQRVARRAVLSVAASLPLALFSGSAGATLLRGLSLPSLVQRSRRVLVLNPLESRCRYAEIGGHRAIITETRARVSQVIRTLEPSESEISVCTLGGVLDGVGELVHGQAELTPGTSCMAFLTGAPDGSLWVTGMAQGHYPLTRASSEPALLASPHLPAMVDFERSAARALIGQSLTRAQRLVLEASKQ